MKPRISIVIPVKNGSQTIVECLEGILSQTLIDQTEIIIIDSGSTDGTLDLILPYNVKLIKIEPKIFNHGTTRNFGVRHSEGEFVVMTVQDAIATDNNWLETMLSHFNDPEVAGVCGQQIVPHHPDKNPHEWYRPQSFPKSKTFQFKDKKVFDTLSPEEQKSACSWDDVNAMYRKSVFQKIPFQSLAFGEDMFWAKQALEQGYKLVYDSAAQVAHYHFQYPEYTYKRTLITNLFIYKCFGYIRPNVYSLKDYLLVIYRNYKWGCSFKWIFHNFNIIYQHRKATGKLKEFIKNSAFVALEKELSINVPIGKQKLK